MQPRIAIVLLLCGITTLVVAQEQQNPRVKVAHVHTAQWGVPSATLEYSEFRSTAASSMNLLEDSTPLAFTAFAIAWSSHTPQTIEGPPTFQVRSRDASGLWTAWRSIGTEATPDETPSGLFWSELALTPDGGAHTAYEIVLPAEVLRSVSTVKVLIMDSRSTVRSPLAEQGSGTQPLRDLHPLVLSRADWWGDLPQEYLNPTNYLPEYISISHAIVHHTAGTNNPPDPAQDIRDIWVYHVFGQGWSDIAYNFLIDQNGRIYQGRYNPYVDLIDVRGSHATYANNQSVGIALLGNFAVDTPPTAVAVQSLIRVIAWRFQQKRLDPLARADMVSDQAGHTVNLYRISGHRDVSATACPGDALYAQLPTIRTTASLLISVEDSLSVPQSFYLAQNYPNPFNPMTTIAYGLPESGNVRLSVYDVLGREVARLVDRYETEGPHQATFNGAPYATGVYIYVLSQGPHRLDRQMLMLR